MEKIIEAFNSFFEGQAKVEVKGNELHVTIGSKTLFIALPGVSGGCSRGSSPTA